MSLIIYLAVFIVGFLYFKKRGSKQLRNFICTFLILTVIGFLLLFFIPSGSSLDTGSIVPEDEEEISYYEPELLYSKSGSSDTVLRSVSVKAPCSLHFKTYDSGHNSIKAYYGDSNYDYDLLVNTVGSYNGSTYLVPGRTYDFEIDCSGKWTVEIYSLGYTDEKYFVGSSDTVTDIFQPISHYYSFSYKGEDNFSVRQWYGTGEYDYDLLVNEIGPYSGTVRISNADKKCFFEIVGSDGVWSITPSP